MFSLALSGGGLLGAAHLGVIQVLEEKKAVPVAIAGTSAGGLVASLVASGVNSREMIQWGRKITLAPWDYFELNEHGLVDEIWPHFGPPAAGLINPQKFLASLLDLAPKVRSINDWLMPCAVTSVDLSTMSAVLFTPHRNLKMPNAGWQIIDHADLMWALGSTMAMPGLFEAVRRNSHIYVDGGIANTLPANWAYELNPGPVLSVNVAKTNVKNGNEMGIGDILSRSEAFVTQYLADVENSGYPVLTICPPTDGTPFFGFHDFDHLVAIGRQTALKYWPQIEAFIAGQPGQTSNS